MVIVTIKHFRACGMCAQGVRRWMIEQGMDVKTFFREGLPADVIEAQGNAMANRAVEHARNG